MYKKGKVTIDELILFIKKRFYKETLEVQTYVLLELFNQEFIENGNEFEDASS